MQTTSMCTSLSVVLELSRISVGNVIKILVVYVSGDLYNFYILHLNRNHMRCGHFIYNFFIFQK